MIALENAQNPYVITGFTYYIMVFNNILLIVNVSNIGWFIFRVLKVDKCIIKKENIPYINILPLYFDLFSVGIIVIN